MSERSERMKVALQRLVRLPRGKCTGCDKVRVRYLAEIWHGRKGFPDSHYRREAYCMECHPDIERSNAPAHPRAVASRGEAGCSQAESTEGERP
jgi:hypothetical protein